MNGFLFASFADDVNGRLAMWGYSRAGSQDIIRAYKLGYDALDAARHILCREAVQKLPGV